MKILILGGTGFVGSYLYNHLKNNYEVDFTSTSKTIGIRYNIEKDSLIDSITKNYDIIINNINPCNLNYSTYVKSLEEIIFLCKEKNIWLIQVSSLSAQNNNRNLNPYNLRKSICDDIIKQELPIEKYTILRFPHLFDNIGLARKSQSGFYYLLDSIKLNKPINLFSNFRLCLRNYLPIELLLNFFDVVLEYKKKGIYNAYLDSFTFKFDELINTLIKLNDNYNFDKLISIGKNEGLIYSIEPQSDDLVNQIMCKTPYYYFKTVYNQLHEEKI